MVFYNLASHEKEAFFRLLDEYFDSRPQLFSSVRQNDGAANTLTRSAAASAAQRAFASNPEATSKMISAGLTHAVPKSSPYSAAVSDPEVNNSIGRVAAASFAFSGGSKPAPPSVPLRAGGHKSVSSSEQQTPADVVDRIPSTTDRLTAARKFGDVDMSSAKGAFTSIRKGTFNKTATPPAAAPPIPPAFPAKKNTFAPPPVRRITPESTETASRPPPAFPRPTHSAPAEEGEWAEVLYEYSSEDPGDMEIRAGERVLVIERSSDDWWMGRLDDKQGLFPASYVRLL